MIKLNCTNLGSRLIINIEHSLKPSKPVRVGTVILEKYEEDNCNDQNIIWEIYSEDGVVLDSLILGEVPEGFLEKEKFHDFQGKATLEVYPHRTEERPTVVRGGVFIVSSGGSYLCQ